MILQNIILQADLKLWDSFYTAIHRLNESGCDSVPVIDDNKQLLGVFTREALYQVLLKNSSLETKIEQYVNSFQGSAIFDHKYDDFKKYIEEFKVCSFFVVDHEKQLLGIIKMKDMISNIRRINWSHSQFEKAISLNFRGAIKTNKEEIIVLLDESILHFKANNYSEIKKSVLKQTELQLSVSLNFIHRDKEGQQGRILQLEPKASASKDHHLLQNDFVLEDIKETKTIKSWQNAIDTIYEQLYDAMIIVNELGEIIGSNHKIPDLFHIENHKVLGLPIKEVPPMLKLEKVIETGVAELSRVIDVNGVLCIVQNIPFFENDHVFGAISRIQYHGINAARERMIHFDLSNKLTQFLELMQRYGKSNLNAMNQKQTPKDRLQLDIRLLKKKAAIMIW